ncbi:MAG: hypothetical protein JWM74_727 [Myxococcaceae bacterium]|jgi:hypothetical protein|nr:hypothetical protein [Myxococcaceae bacterium]
MKSAGLVLVSIVVFGVAACGGPDKPPLTPDQDNPMGMDGGADPSATPPADPASTPVAPAK